MCTYRYSVNTHTVGVNAPSAVTQKTGKTHSGRRSRTSMVALGLFISRVFRPPRVRRSLIHEFFLTHSGRRAQGHSARRPDLTRDTRTHTSRARSHARRASQPPTHTPANVVDTVWQLISHNRFECPVSPFPESTQMSTLCHCRPWPTLKRPPTAHSRHAPLSLGRLGSCCRGLPSSARQR